MKSVESFCKKAIKMGIEGAKVINPGSVVTAEWVRMKCQYGCPGFGESLCCPPRTPTPDMTRKVIDCYQKAILLHQRLVKGKTRWARFDNFSKAIVRLEVEIFLDGYYKAWSMGCGPCDLARNVTFRVLVNTGLRRDLRWKHVALMYLRRQGTMGFLLKLCGHEMMK